MPPALKRDILKNVSFYREKANDSMVKNMSTTRREEMPKRYLKPPADTPEVLARALRWRTIWARVIAEAWADPDGFKQKLIASPDSARDAIKEKFKYVLSPELKLTIKEAKNAKYDPNHGFDTKGDENDGWTDIPQMELTLYIPAAPQEDQRAVALTHYSETGRTYPMTSA